ncbi:MAG TPA: vWA domain-containing protein [Aridibacter sp.]|nr:vWA domain-containing protein [Aridibacter sp.]
MRLFKASVASKPILVLITLLAFAFPVAGQDSRTENGSSCGILLDNTGSMRFLMGEVSAVGFALVDHLAADCKIAIFDHESTRRDGKIYATVRSDPEWTNDLRRLAQRLELLRTVGGRTTLFDSIAKVAKSIAKEAGNDDKNERVLVVVTDGEDRASKIKEKELIEELLAIKVKVFAVALTEELSTDGGLFVSKSPKKKAESALRNITKKTGGNVVILSEKDDPKLGDLMKQLFSEIEKEPSKSKK